MLNLGQGVAWDDWIGRGWVKVNGELAIMGMQVTPDVRIEIAKQAQGQQANQVTILLNKPIGLVSGQAEDGYENASTLIRSDTHWADDTSGLKYHIGHSRSLAPAGKPSRSRPASSSRRGKLSGYEPARWKWHGLITNARDSRAMWTSVACHGSLSSAVEAM